MTANFQSGRVISRLSKGVRVCRRANLDVQMLDDRLAQVWNQFLTYVSPLHSLTQSFTGACGDIRPDRVHLHIPRPVLYTAWHLHGKSSIAHTDLCTSSRRIIDKRLERSSGSTRSCGAIFMRHLASRCVGSVVNADIACWCECNQGV